jgi:hypothetical protein
MSPEFKMPANLSESGVSAYSAIMDVLNKYEAESGGCKTFYSPAEWAKRGEDYGKNSHLIVVYDGGDVRSFFNMNTECYKFYEEMQDALKKVGLYFEECTGWYAAIYNS